MGWLSMFCQDFVDYRYCYSILMSWISYYLFVVQVQDPSLIYIFLQIDLERDELIRRMSDFNIRIPKRREARQPHLSEENQLILKV